MMKEVIATGRTVDAAIENGCLELGLPREETDFEIIDMPHKGFLGLTQTPAKVRVFAEVKDEAPAKTASAKTASAKTAPAPTAPAKKQELEKPADSFAKSSDDGQQPQKTGDYTKKREVASKYLADILCEMGLDNVTINSSMEDNTLNFKIEGDVTGVSIGRRGETLDAMQYLLGLAVNRVEGDYMRIVLDSGNYRDKRRNTLEQLAKKLAMSVVKTGRSTTLEPMNPYERRIIHSAVSQVEGAVSSSVGEEPNRCVVISSTNPRPQSTDGRPPYRGGKRYPDNNRRSGGYNNDRRGGGQRGPRREKPPAYQESGKREVPPLEAQDKPLYGKVEI